MEKSDTIKVFSEYLHIYKGAYQLETSSSWIHVNKYLTDLLLEKQLFPTTKTTIGMYGAYCSNFFCLDIDNHLGENVRDTYYEIQSILGQASFLIQSPSGGVHAYYLLSSPISLNILKQWVMPKLSHIKNVEFKPLSKVGLRLPNFNSMLSNDTWTFFKLPKPTLGPYLKSRIQYNPLEFKEEKTVIKKLHTSYDDVIIMKGETNEAIQKYIIPLRLYYGYTLEECIEWFLNHLSPDYNGPCRNKRHLEQRFKSAFKQDFTVHTIKKESPIDYSNSDLFKSIVQLQNKKLTDHNKNLRIERLRKSFNTLMWIYNSHQQIKENKELYYDMCSKYSFYYRETQRGCYPIPSSLIPQKDIQYFIHIGLLSLPYGKHYSTNINSCIYYLINTSINNNIDTYTRYITSLYYNIPSINKSIHTYPILSVQDNTSIKDLVPCQGKIFYNMFYHPLAVHIEKLFFDG
jgi:hypothetical protein